MATKKAPDVHIALTTHPDADKGPSALQHALGLSITDKVSHESVRAFSKELKEKRRDIEAYYRTKANGTGIIDPLYKAYKAALATMEAHCLPYDQAIKACEAIDVAYVTEQRMIEAEAQEKIRRKAEADETARREKEAAEAEAAALKLEASSNVLSEREQKVVRAWVAHNCKQDVLIRILTQVGYKDAAQQAKRLHSSDKFRTAVANEAKAQRLREEAAAAAAKPVIVDVPQVESQIVDGGMRTYWACDGFDLASLLAKLATDVEDPKAFQLRADVERYLMPALLTLMSAQARSLKEMFPKAWPMAQLARKEGTISR